MQKQTTHIQVTPTTKVADLVDYDSHLLLMLNRFNIPLGFGDKTIKEVCLINNVDMDCFISITQLLLNPKLIDAKTLLNLNPLAVVDYLRYSHSYFTERRLPDIRRKLQEILIGEDETYKTSILNFFDQYSDEVNEHMNYENDTVFPYIEELILTKQLGEFTIDEFESNHSNIEDKMSDLKHLIIKYVPLSGDNYKITNVLFDLFLSEEDLNTHCLIEDTVLIPLVRRIEKQFKQL